MTNLRYFFDHGAETFELKNIWHVGPGTKAAKNFSGLLPDGRRVAATRIVNFKSNPSRHECDARCYGATGKTFNCECACGGKNHGKGSIVCEEVAR